jgi:L-threonylcarbamoyladenylate synthase
MKIINEKDSAAADIAADFLKAGKIISFATDTVYGVAVDASNEKAVASLYQLKNRDQKKPIAIFVKDIASAKKNFSFSKKAEEIAEKFLPGALTLVLPIRPETSLDLASNLNNNHDGFLGFRIVDTDFIKKLFEKFDGILAVTSANLSGEKEAQNAQEVAKKFLELDLLIDGEITSKTPSTVAKIIEDKITILRQGPIFL